MGAGGVTLTVGGVPLTTAAGLKTSLDSHNSGCCIHGHQKLWFDRGASTIPWCLTNGPNSGNFSGGASLASTSNSLPASKLSLAAEGVGPHPTSSRSRAATSASRIPPRSILHARDKHLGSRSFWEKRQRCFTHRGAMGDAPAPPGRGKKPFRGRGRGKDTRDVGRGAGAAGSAGYDDERPNQRADPEDFTNVTATSSGMVPGRCAVVAIIGDRRPPMLNGFSSVAVPDATIASFCESVLKEVVPDAPLPPPPSPEVPPPGDEIEVRQDLSSRTIFVFLAAPGDPSPQPEEHEISASTAYLAGQEQVSAPHSPSYATRTKARNGQSATTLFSIKRHCDPLLQEHAFLRRALLLFSCSHAVIFSFSSARLDPSVRPRPQPPFPPRARALI